MIILAQVREAAVPDTAQVQTEWTGLLARLGETVVRGRLEAFGMAEADVREILGRGCASGASSPTGLAEASA
jgi:hypothetical protein